MLKFQHGHCGKGHRVTGIVLVVLGCFWFAHKAGWIPVHAGGSVLFWPLLTIVIGVTLLCLPKRDKQEHER